MIIVISPLEILPNEINIVNEMLHNDLELFHFRKYGIDDSEVIGYFDQLDENFKSRLVLHSHQHLADTLGLQRLHFNANYRLKNEITNDKAEIIYSTSTHSMGEFNELRSNWSYAFLSPTFQSISKPGYGKSNSILKEISMRENFLVNLIGLGGINYQNMELLLLEGFNGLALLGALWNQKDPANYLKSCKLKESQFKGEQTI